MKRVFDRLAVPVLLLAATPALVLAYPAKVKTAGGQSQTVIMCPDCSAPIACARVGEYTIAFSADLDTPKTGGNVGFHVRLTDAKGAPVTNARVAVALSMPGHEHQPRTLPLKRGSGGLYSARTTFKSVEMPGPWEADVEVTTPKGDKVIQAFTFNR
jgi:hypothetical protein